MNYCPYCGTPVKDEELFCIHCGKELPKDIGERNQNKKRWFNKWWFLPIGSILLLLIVFIGLHFFQMSEEEKAIQAYEKGVELALNKDFSQAKQSFKEALDNRKNFKAATHNYQFMDIAISIDEMLNSAEVLMKEQSFQPGLTLIEDAENLLNNYDGELVDLLLHSIVELRNDIQTKELHYKLEQKPSIEELKILLWQAESIQTNEAKGLTNDIRNRIVDYTYSTANEFLQQNQYSDAIAIVNDGLRYATNNEKLESLKRTIEKEKVAFETEQEQRIQQAMDAAEQEQERNENDAIEIISIQSKLDEYGDLIVSGAIKSVATVPIYSISIEYNLLDENEDPVDTNTVFTYPDMLYPNEEGKFEFTHYGMKEELHAEIVKVQWFLDSP